MSHSPGICNLKATLRHVSERLETLRRREDGSVPQHIAEIRHMVALRFARNQITEIEAVRLQRLQVFKSGAYVIVKLLADYWCCDRNSGHARA